MSLGLYDLTIAKGIVQQGAAVVACSLHVSLLKRPTSAVHRLALAKFFCIAVSTFPGAAVAKTATSSLTSCLKQLHTIFKAVLLTQYADAPSLH